MVKVEITKAEAEVLDVELRGILAKTSRLQEDKCKIIEELLKKVEKWS